MEIHLFSQQELPIVFRVLRTALSPFPLTQKEESFLKTYSKITGFTPSDLSPLSTHASFDFQITDPHKAKRLVQLAAMAVLLSNPLREPSIRFLEELALHLKVQEPVLTVIRAVLNGRKFKARFLTIRRAAGMIFGEAYRREGVLGLIRFFAAVIGRIRVNKDKLWKYKRLGLLPEGTLGREYWKHITEVGFGFPGEPGGIPETVSYHDVSHVLNDHNTTPLGEMQQGSFQGGSRKEGGFGFVQFVILQFHHGIRITPVAKSEVGTYDPALILWAIHRGANFKYDVTTGWDYWPLMPLPIEKARAQCGLIPKLSETN